jgi:DNA helicase-2/ATP-dependent DNA helicase PcrA
MRPSNQKILADLNSEQIKAATAGGGPLLIIAGAGTGKTTVITRRIAWLIAEKMARPGEILALTFTDKAANEMEARVDLLVPYGYVDVSIATFHAFGDRVLREYALDLGLRPDYRVLSLAEQIIFFREHLFDFPLRHYKSLGDPTRHIEALVGVISRAKDEDVSPEEYLRWAKKIGSRVKPCLPAGRGQGDSDAIKKQLEVAKIYKKYQELKAGKGMVDFGDQVSLALKLFREHSSILKEFQERYKFILVDEFQDTNFAQFELLKLLAGKKANLAVVGDDDQSIYKFRGAAISNILNFEKAYPGCGKIVLTQNYRSTQTILDSARRLIKHNDPDRLEVKAGVDKRLVAWKPANKFKVEHKHFDKVGSEADWVARTINTRKYPLQEYAILVRSNADAEPFRQSLNLLGIPHQFSGGGGLYVFPEIKLLVSFLRVIGDPADSVSLYDLALSEIYQLNPLDLQKINTFADRRNLTLHHVFTHLDEVDLLADVKDATRATIRKIMEDIARYLDFARQKTTGEVLYQFLKESGVLLRLTREQSLEKESRLKNIARFFEKVREFKEVAEVDRVSEFVKYLNILKEAGDDPESSRPDIEVDAVNVLTVHRAKGLEFSVVFLVALVVDKFPVRSRKHPIELPAELIKEEVPYGDFHLMEERRLFYVGMTRARRELYLTSAVDYGGKRDRKVSPFVLEALDLPKADISILKKPALAEIELFAPAQPVAIGERRFAKDAIIPLSHYQIDDYLTCPLKYKYVHVLRVPLLPNHQIIYGLALHQAVQAYCIAKKEKQRFSEKQLLDTFANNWSSEGFISRTHEEQRFIAGKNALRKFFRSEKKRKRIPKFVEEDFTILEDKIQVRGRWDLVESSKIKSQKSKIFIVDFKSSEVKDQNKADERAKKSLQLNIYALAWRKMFGHLPDGLELYFLETGLIGLAKPSEKDLIETWEKIKTVAAGLRAADYHATPGYRACSYCPYNEICPSSAV